MLPPTYAYYCCWSFSKLLTNYDLRFQADVVSCEIEEGWSGKKVFGALDSRGEMLQKVEISKCTPSFVHPSRGRSDKFLHIGGG